MSRHFNYELDERRIKILLSENHMPFSEDVWNEFIEKTKPIERVSKLPAVKLNLAINRSVLLTAVFIILIGSFTLVVAKFVDFSSTKTNTETLREVKPDPNNFKIEKIATALPKKEVAKPTATVSAQTTTLNTVTVPTNSAQQYASVPNNTYSPTSNTQTVTNNDNSMMSRTIPNATTSVKDSALVNQANQARKFKKKKKEVEPMETKPLTTGLPIINNEEQPEPELKLE